MRRAIPVAVVALVAAMPLQGLAQDQIPRPFNAQETLRFDAGSSVGATWQSTLSIGPYEGTLLTMQPGQPSITLYCIDFAHSVSIGQVWDVNVSSITDGSDLGQTRLGHSSVTSVSDEMVRYRKAAFLSSLFTSYSTATLGEVNGSQAVATADFDVSNASHAWSGIHAAIWQLTSQDLSREFPDDWYGTSDEAEINDIASAWLDWADAMAQHDATLGLDLSEWSVLTDTRARGESHGRQEYLVRTTVTPEPETYLLMLSGMLLMGVVARRRLRELGFLG